MIFMHIQLHNSPIYQKTAMTGTKFKPHNNTQSDKNYLLI
jgi:hypothetical protein